MVVNSLSHAESLKLGHNTASSTSAPSYEVIVFNLLLHGVEAVGSIRESEVLPSQVRLERQVQVGRQSAFICVPLLGFPGGSVVKNSPANAGDAGD